MCSIIYSFRQVAYIGNFIIITMPPYSSVKIQYLTIIVTTIKLISLMHDQKHKFVWYLLILWWYCHEIFRRNFNFRFVLLYFFTFNVIFFSLWNNFHEIRGYLSVWYISKYALLVSGMIEEQFSYITYSKKYFSKYFWKMSKVTVFWSICLVGLSIINASNDMVSLSFND